MRKTAVTSLELTPPVGPFSQAVEAGGFIYFSGQVGQDPATGKLGGEWHLRQAFQSTVSGPHGDCGGRAAARGLR